MSDLFLFRNSLRDLLRARRVMAALALVAVPAGIAGILRAALAPGVYSADAVYNALSPGIVFGFILVILSVVFGTGVVSQDIEQKTIVYLLTRPVPRWRIILVKFAAALLVTTVVVWLAAAALAVVAYGPRGVAASRLGRDLAILPLGALAYSALFLLLATLFNRPLMYGLLFAFGWESWVPNLPGNFGKISLMSYLRVLAPHPKEDTGERALQELLQMLTPATITRGLAWGVLITVSVAALAGALWVFSRSEYVPREDAE